MATRIGSAGRMEERMGYNSASLIRDLRLFDLAEREIINAKTEGGMNELHH